MKIKRTSSEKSRKPSTAKSAAAIVFVSKNDGSVHFSVDNHKLHAIAGRDLYPFLSLSLTVVYFRRLGEGPVFSTPATTK